MPEPSPTRVLRRALEDALDTRLASVVLFEALGMAGAEVPRGLEGLLEVLRGPLREVLARRLDPARADALVREIEEELAPAPGTPATVEVPIDQLVPAEEREDATAPLLRLRGPVRVAVLAEGTGLAGRLLATLGEHRVLPCACAEPERWPEPEPPQVVILDASDFPRGPAPGALRAWAEGLPPSTALVLWAPRLPYGRSFRQEDQEGGRTWLTFDPKEGIAPLLDLIRSRRRSPA